MSTPSVTVAIPVLNEEKALRLCLDAVNRQSYNAPIETVVADGGSTDRTVEIAREAEATVIENPGRRQAAGLNRILDVAMGDIIVRVDGHCVVADDYVERCVAALGDTGAAMVGGAMTPRARGWKQEGIAAAMASKWGAGPARFHVGGAAGWVDTVYLGAYRAELARRVGGYAEDVGVNEDAELAWRMGQYGGVWFDPSIRSTYTPRADWSSVVRQFYAYGTSRAATLRKHPRATRARQVAPCALLVGLLSPYRRTVACMYGAAIAASVLSTPDADPKSAFSHAVSLPAMHLPWAVGFLVGVGRQGLSTAGRPDGEANPGASRDYAP